MRRLILGMFIAVVGALAVVSSAGAAAGQTVHFRFHGNFAEADWFVGTNTSFADTSFNASQSKDGKELFIERFVGTQTGETDTVVDVTTGFSFAIDSKKLSTASVSGSSLPATRCTYDVDFNLIGCSHVRVAFQATLAGQGPIGRGTSNDHFKVDGFSETDHFNGTSRNATATGNFAGIALRASQLQFADLGHTNDGSVVVCKGTGC
jgi:hypothetical protein